MSQTEDLAARRAELADRINGAAPPPVRPWTWYPAAGPDVAYLQGCLEVHGFYKASEGDPEGLFDRSTEAAVRAFQVSRGVRPDAVVSDVVWQLLGEDPHGR